MRKTENRLPDECADRLFRKAMEFAQLRDGKKWEESRTSIHVAGLPFPFLLQFEPDWRTENGVILNIISTRNGGVSEGYIAGRTFYGGEICPANCVLTRIARECSIQIEQSLDSLIALFRQKLIDAA